MSRDKRPPPSSTQIEDRLSAKFASAERIGDIPLAEVVSMADDFGRVLAKNVRLKTTQVRKFFEAVKRLAADLRTQRDLDLAGQCALLRPLLAHMAGRQDSVRPLMRVLDPCLQKIHTKGDFLTFYRFLESTLAYHRFYGGRDY